MTRWRRAASGLSLLALLGFAAPASAVDVASQPGLERKKIEPAKERTIEAGERKTLATEAEAKDRKERRGRVALQIPEALRKRVELRIESRITRNVELARRLRRQALGMLRTLLSELPPDARELPSTLMRLGELEWEDAREQFLVEFEAWENLPVDQRGEPPLPNYSGPRGRFAQVLAEHPGFERYDLALYVDGFLASEEGRAEDSLARFNRILAEFPQSPFVPDAHMVRAEAEFAKPVPNYQYAFEEYEAVLAHPGTEIYDLALFKSAWALWRLGQSDEAARRFLSVFKASAERKGVSDVSGRQQELDQLQTQALKNLVAVFVEDEKNSADDMHGFLVKAGGERFASEIVEALAKALYEQAHYARGIEAYRLLLRLDPTSEHAYEHALSIADGHSTMESWDELAEDYRWILEEYVASLQLEGAAKASEVAPPRDPASNAGARPRTRGAWLAVQDEATKEKAKRAIESALYEHALGLHAKAQADRVSRVEFQAASDLYGVYLTRFAELPRAYEVYFNRGEINFHRLDDAAVAADSYLAAVKLRPGGPWSRDALYNALAALETARENEFRAAKARGQKPEETPTDKKLTEAMELYSSTYPDDPELPEMLFRQGRLYYDYALFDPAVRQWGLLLEKHPDSEYARGAGELILDSFNRSRDYENIETWGKRLLEAPAFREPKGQQRLSKLIVQAIFKQGEAHAQAGRHSEAAAAYLRAASEFPKQGRAAEAAVNACIESQKAVDLEQMKVAVSLLTEGHRKSPIAAQGVWIAASMHQSIGLLDEAAGYHEVLAKNWPKDEHHADAAYNAVLLRTTLGQRDQAVAAGKVYNRHYPRGEGSDEVSFLIGKAHEQAEDWRAAEAVYAKYSSSAKLSSRRIEALVRLAVARVELGDESGAKSALSRAVKQHGTYRKSLDDRGKYFGARAHFMQAQRTLAEFEKIRIEGDVAQLGKRLKRKADLLKQASNALLDTAKLGVAEWTTASLYQIGFIYESFSKSLMDSPPPPSLSPEQAEEYAMQIDTFVIPIEEKSLEAYESGWHKALELGIFNSWTAKMRQALGRLNAELYPPLTEVGFRLRSSGATRLPDLIRGTRRTKEGKSQRYLMEASRAIEAPRESTPRAARDASPVAARMEAE